MIKFSKITIYVRELKSDIAEICFTTTWHHLFLISSPFKLYKNIYLDKHLLVQFPFGEDKALKLCSRLICNDVVTYILISGCIVYMYSCKSFCIILLF